MFRDRWNLSLSSIKANVILTCQILVRLVDAKTYTTLNYPFPLSPPLIKSLSQEEQFFWGKTTTQAFSPRKKESFNPFGHPYGPVSFYYHHSFHVVVGRCPLFYVSGAFDVTLATLRWSGISLQPAFTLLLRNFRLLNHNTLL